jgi:MbtH protein
MDNPFDNQDGTFLALINHEGQYSLWPAFATVPAGWETAHEEDTRKACLDFIEEHWTDMRPRSLIEKLKEYEGAE